MLPALQTSQEALVKIIPVITLVLGSAPAWATKGSPTEGTLQTRDGNEIVAVPLEHTEVKVSIDGFVADVEVDQRFHNPYRHKIEAIYLFPLPALSAVDGYELAIGDRTIKGELKLKDEAKSVYTAARTKGFVAALLTQERPNLFTQSVANIEPGATIDVRLHYVQALAYDDGAYELVFPMVAGPRFVPKSSKAGAAVVQPAVLPPGTRSGHDIGLTVAIDGGVPIHDVRSPSHAIDVANASTHEASVKISARDTVPNKDFILRYDVAAARGPEFAVVPHRSGGIGSFFFMAQPPVRPDAAEVTPKEMVFVIDTSSSMQGAPLAKAKEAVARALRGMHPEDTFQIVRFDDSASALGPKPIANKPNNVERALAWLGQLEAGGGTDMTTGITAALAFPHDRARLRVVVFLTDGFIGNEDEILAQVQQSLGDARLFSFGVGSAVNRYLLEEMAAIGRGTVQVVRPDEDTTAAVERLEKRIASPLLTDISIDWKGLAVADVSPSRIPDLFAGQPLVLAGRYSRPGAATVSVTGKLAGRTVSFDVPVALPETRDRPAIAAIWSRGRITELARQQLRAEKPEVKKQIIELALANHLMSAYTAFVAVDSSRKTAGGKADPVAVPVEVPDVLRSTTANYGGSGGGAVYGLEVSSSAAGAEAPQKAMAHDKAKSAGVLGQADVHAHGDAQAEKDGDEVSKAVGQPAPLEEGWIAAGKSGPWHAAKAPSRIEAKRETKPEKTAPPPDTAEATMRADVGRCWAGDAHGTIHVAIDFDPSGAAKSVAVTGDADKAVGECVRGLAKKWRSLANKHFDLGIKK
jgi:Ca-activated chloride channel family protein